MSLEKNRNKILFQPLIILALFLFNQPLFSQNSSVQDTTIKVSRGSYLQSRYIKKFLQHDTLINVSRAMVPSVQLGGDRTIAFYDSLKSIASKTILTQALYDLVIVSPDSAGKQKAVRNSQNSFNEFSGKKIRKISIHRINVFGTDINNPGYYNPDRTKRFLNDTHVNTNESVIEKFLLFSEGDTLSPLKLSDNERIIRQLSFIDDARIIVVPVSGGEADIVVVTKDVFSLGGEPDIRSARRGKVSLWEKNIFGMGHEFYFDVPYSSGWKPSPGIGLKYNINNIRKSFINLSLNYYDAIGTKTYGINLTRDLISSTTKYAGGISLNQTFTYLDMYISTRKQDLFFNNQDYWLMRSFLIDRESVTRIILGVRYTYNNVYKRPIIDAKSFYDLQSNQLFIQSLAISAQKYYKTSLLYSYGRTEDVPYGMLIKLSAGEEVGEFKNRPYTGLEFSFGHFAEKLGYLYFSAGLGTFFNKGLTEQGEFFLRMKYFSDLVYLGNYKIRNFVNIDYTRGFDRYSDEYLVIPRENGFSGLSNVYFSGSQRIILSLESVLFSPSTYIGFKYAVFGFTDLAYVTGTRKVTYPGGFLSGIGVGIRIRNDNLVFNTLQIRVGFFPNPPQYSRIEYVIPSGEQLLRPANFDPGPPAPIPYR